MSIVVVGSLNMDTTLKVPHIPSRGETILASGKRNSRGGKGQNQAVAAKRLGAEVYMIGAVGNDEEGSSLKEELKSDGVKTDYVFVKDNVTGYANILLDDDGNNNIVVYSGANYDLSIGDIQRAEDVFDGIEYCLLQLEIPLETVYYVLELCKKRGITTVLNPAPVVSGFDVSCLKNVDYLVPNESELELLSGRKIKNKDIESLSQVLLGYGCSNVIVTLGDEGSAYFSKDKSFNIDARKVDVVDSTAAGDSYVGALTVYLQEGKTIREAMKFATIVSAETVTKKGAINSLPYREEIRNKWGI